MRNNRILIKSKINCKETITVAGDAFRHLIHVLRLKTDDTFIAFDGSGNDYFARIEKIFKQNCIARIEKISHSEKKVGLHIGLAIGISKSTKMDFIIQKAVELGVVNIAPLFTEHSQIKLKESRLQNKMQRWETIINSACEQSGRSLIPKLSLPVNFITWLQNFKGMGVLLDSQGDFSPNNIPKPSENLNILVGPEGGLSEFEKKEAKKYGLMSMRLGPRIMRTETAPIAAISVFQSLWGDFN
tara:strand:+ start:2041 stop:2769 length:729 start_codon:yes stop_codon:yes gene_type:complete